MPDTKTPEQWAQAKGHLHSWQFAVARTLHGWIEHAHHAGQPIQLTEVDYNAAIAAAATPTGDPIPHEPALSQYAPCSRKQASNEEKAQ